MRHQGAEPMIRSLALAHSPPARSDRMSRLFFPDNLALFAAVLHRCGRDAAVVVLVAGAPAAACVIADGHREAFAVGVVITLAPHGLAARGELRFERCSLATHPLPPAKGWAQRVISLPLAARRRKSSPGHDLVGLLTAQGHRVRVLARRPGHDPNIEWVTGDLGTGAGVAGAVAGVDAIVHAATHSPAAQRGKLRLGDLIRAPSDVDIGGTRRLLA